MASQQSGSEQGPEQLGATSTRVRQLEAGQPAKIAPVPTQAAFGTGSGAAVVFRDFASI